MSAVPLSHDDEQEKQDFPLTSELIGTVLGHKQLDVFQNKHIRFLRQHANRLQDGRITLVIKHGRIVAIETAKTYDFSDEK